MSEALDRLRAEMNDVVRQDIRRVSAWIKERREEILFAFLAKYGCEPNEVIQLEITDVDGNKRWEVRGPRETCPAPPESSPAPVPMLLHCPECRARHIDVGEFATKVHHTHACQECGHVWRPAIGPTVGVQFLPGFKNEAPAPALGDLREAADLDEVAKWILDRLSPTPLCSVKNIEFLANQLSEMFQRGLAVGAPSPVREAHPTDHAFVPDADCASDCGVCGWEGP